ncbi:MAG TPA: signal peptidase I [Acidimicrobiia bacterium]|nr:signal peptidase I [Acidimicrobiia bacterium]
MRRFWVEDRSMEPSVGPGKTLFCRRLGTRPSRGLIVVFHHPRRAELWLVKRIVGLPGEEVVVDFGEVVVDGRSGVDVWGAGQETFPEGRWKVGPGEVLVLSDNRPATADDGRSFGPIPMSGMMKVIWPRMRRSQSSKRP